MRLYCIILMILTLGTGLVSDLSAEVRKTITIWIFGDSTACYAQRE